ncbi:hypothetical protein PMI41_01413 [Phyllobacterium sp. YR531]|nr:hypothetical protein PMI41_01413 [Phyllobacterium sp. YR531]
MLPVSRPFVLPWGLRQLQSSVITAEKSKQTNGVYRADNRLSGSVYMKGILLKILR